MCVRLDFWPHSCLVYRFRKRAVTRLKRHPAIRPPRPASTAARRTATTRRPIRRTKSGQRNTPIREPTTKRESRAEPAEPVSFEEQLDEVVAASKKTAARPAGRGPGNLSRQARPRQRPGRSQGQPPQAASLGYESGRTDFVHQRRRRRGCKPTPPSPGGCQPRALTLGTSRALGASFASSRLSWPSIPTPTCAGAARLKLLSMDAEKLVDDDEGADR